MAKFGEDDTALHDFLTVCIEQPDPACSLWCDASPNKIGQEFTSSCIADALAFEQLAPEATTSQVVECCLVGHQPIRVQLDGGCQHFSVHRPGSRVSGDRGSAHSRPLHHEGWPGHITAQPGGCFAKRDP